MMPALLLALLPFVLLSGTDKEVKAPEITYAKFGEITVDGTLYKHDIVIENGVVRKRKKGPSREQKAKYGHTPLTPGEAIPWDCKTLVIGTGMHGRLPVVPKFEEEARRKGVKLIVRKTKEAVKYYHDHFGPGINAILHITC